MSLSSSSVWVFSDVGTGRVDECGKSESRKFGQRWFEVESWFMPCGNN